MIPPENCATNNKLTSASPTCHLAASIGRIGPSKVPTTPTRRKPKHMKRANCLPRCPEQASASPIDSEWFSPMATLQWHRTQKKANEGTQPGRRRKISSKAKNARISSRLCHIHRQFFAPFVCLVCPTYIICKISPSRREQL